MSNEYDFYRNKKVLVTGHTGFKGTWLCKLLNIHGAEIVGYALPPDEGESIYNLSGIDKHIKSIYGDIRDFDKLKSIFIDERPEIVFHLAAQPLVRESYINPLETYETNVMGTVNVLECIRRTDSVKSFVNVTTDKVYLNREDACPHGEDDVLNGHDPYSNSKSCSELATYAYKNSFFESSSISISTARAGNVIGGGDFAQDRILVDCFRAAQKREKILVRNPYSIRPYQHVLEAVVAYLMIAKAQFDDKKISGCYNIGPNEQDCISTETLVKIFCDEWQDGTEWINCSTDGPYEAKFLKLDCSKMRQVFKWKPKWNVNYAVKKTVELYKCSSNNEVFSRCMNQQIREYMKED